MSHISLTLTSKSVSVPVISFDRFGEREKGSPKANTTMFYLSIDLVLEVFIAHSIGEICAFSLNQVWHTYYRLNSSYAICAKNTILQFHFVLITMLSSII